MKMSDVVAVIQCKITHTVDCRGGRGGGGGGGGKKTHPGKKKSGGTNVT